jgi:predicted ATPase/DNA-binding SARP family transcriptional activator
LVTTDRLVEDLWPGDQPETARHALHVYVSRLRKALGPDRDKLESRGSGYLLSIEPNELDAARFERLAIEGRAARARRDPETAASVLREALSLWRGPALADFSDAPFAQAEAARLEELRLATMQQRIWADLELGRHSELVDELENLVSLHPLREAFWEQLMVALYGAGRQADALRVFQTARTTLAEELGLEPGPALRRAEERILAQDPALDLESAESAGGSPGWMPLHRTSFVGRERELAQGAALFGQSRLMTLTGPPGSGKTRLALRLAADHQDAFIHGSFFIPLAAIGNPRSVEIEIARALGLRDAPGESVLDGVKAFLRDRQALLILDNFEQLIPAAPQIGELLDAAPGIRVLVTSRSPLGISGEQEFPVQPLRIPPRDESPEFEALGDYDAIALFVARARAVDPSFVLSRENAADVAQVTVRLDGLPLAIELAAARIKVLNPEDLLQRLEQRLSVLTGGPVDAERRHRTMRDAIAWSFELLEPEEQILFGRLGVFQGGFTPEAAAAVAGLAGRVVFDGISLLLSQSLLYRPVDVGRARFAMLETMREFALEQLELAGETEEIGLRYGNYFVRLAQEVEPQLTHEPDGMGIERLSAERDNLRGVLSWAEEHDQPDIGLELGGAIWRYWHGTGLLQEGIGWLDGLLAHPAASLAARAKGLTALAGLAYWQTDYDRAWKCYQEALEAYRSIGDPQQEADTLYAMSMTASFVGDLSAAEQLADEALSMFEEMGDREGVGRVLLAQAQKHWFIDHDLEKARPLWEESLAISTEIGNRAMAASQLCGLAGIQFAQGDRATAKGTAFAALEMATAARSVPMTVFALEIISVCTVADEPRSGVRLAGAAASLRNVAGGFTLEVAGIPTARDQASTVLTEGAMELEWNEGAVMSLQQAVNEAYQLEQQLHDPESDGATRVEGWLSGR